MQLRQFYLSVLASSLLSYSNVSLACTDFRVAANDGTEVIARSMEFAMQFNSDIVSVPRGTAFNHTAPDGKPAMAWKTKYGYVLLNGMKELITIDGMNEQGLAFEYLYLPGFTKFQTVPAGKDAQAVPYFHFGDWVLGNFKTVDEVRQALSNIFVYEQTMPKTGDIIFPVHAAIHDASGKGIVVEFVNGQMNIHDYMGVMTNSPTYDWQVTNLSQYVSLTPYNPQPLVVNGVAYLANGAGAGELGMPGDISPASRFVKMAYMLQYSYKAADAPSAVTLAQHIINNVDIPLGTVRAKVNGQDSADMTQWAVFKDLTHKVLYYRSYQDTTLRSIDLTKVDFSEKAPQLVMGLSNTPTVLDVTDKFKQSFVATPAPAMPVASAPASSVKPMPAAPVAPAAKN